MCFLNLKMREALLHRRGSLEGENLQREMIVSIFLVRREGGWDMYLVSSLSVR